MVPPVGLIKAGEAPAFQKSALAAKGNPAQALIGQVSLELALGLKWYPFIDWQRDFNHGGILHTGRRCWQLEVSFLVPSCIAYWDILNLPGPGGRN